MKRLFENWNRYIKENIEYFGQSMVDFKEIVEKGENPVTAAKSLFGEPLGEGSTRIVFFVGDDVVLKVINIPEQYSDESELEMPDAHGFTKSHKLNANKYESDLRMQMRYSDVFPRTFETAEDGTWILAENVEPISYPELFARLELTPQMGINREKFRLGVGIAYEVLQKKNIDNDTDNYLANLLKEVDDMTQTFDQQNQDTLAQTARTNVTGGAPAPRSNQQFFEIPKKMLANSEFRRILSVAGLMDVPPREIKAANLGISKITGKLVLLDTSLW